MGRDQPYCSSWRVYVSASIIHLVATGHVAYNSITLVDCDFKAGPKVCGANAANTFAVFVEISITHWSLLSLNHSKWSDNLFDICHFKAIMRWIKYWLVCWCERASLGSHICKLLNLSIETRFPVSDCMEKLFIESSICRASVKEKSCPKQYWTGNQLRIGYSWITYMWCQCRIKRQLLNQYWNSNQG